MNEKDHQHAHHPDHSHSSPASQEGKKDPVCGMTVKGTTPHTYEYAGQRYFFCGARCLEKFRAEPERYLEPAKRHSMLDVPAQTPQSRAAGEGAVYTCPMHPEIVRSEPGSCPICGMALEPRTV